MTVEPEASRSPTTAALSDAATPKLPSDTTKGNASASGSGEVSYPSAPDATTMAQIRTAIDDLDRQIVTLLGKRMRYIEAAARIKPSRSVVRDQWRVNDVLTKVKAQASKVDFPEGLAEQVYATLVEGSIQHEFKRWDETREPGDRAE